MYKFEVYKDKAGEFRFRFKASNGEAMSAIESIKKNTPSAEVVDQTKAES
jgi:uncharacterized protein YegP (UPF0339 family)